MNKVLLIIILVLYSLLWHQHNRVQEVSKERDRYRQNTETLLSEVRRMQLDSTTMALDVRALKLTVSEYKRLRSADAEKIQEMGVRLKSLRAVARHEAVVDAPISSPIRDTLIVRDSNAVTVQRIEMQTPYIQLSGTIEKKQLQGRIYLPVTLQQAVWIEYKRRWIFWKKVKAVHQTITSNNPYVEILYSEYIAIQE